MAQILKGKPVALAINERNLETIQKLKEKGIIPTLALFRVGERDDDLSYERSILKKAEKLGIKVKQYVFDIDVEEKTFYDRLDEANKDENIHAILVFRPLPKKRFDDETLRNRIDPYKDIDGCSDLSLAAIFTKKSFGFAPCTAQAVIEMLDHYELPIEGKNVVVIGRSLVIGKPVSMLLLNRNATVTICHTRTKDIKEITKKADILVCAIGNGEMIDASYVSEGQIVIDVGITWSEAKQKLCGDVLYEQVEPLVGCITPVPGGVGSITTSILLGNVVKACEKLSG